MKLQIAMDTLSPEELLDFFSKVRDCVDIIELGTPYVLQYGIGIIKELRKISDDVEILCDSKIMDAGFFEADELFKKGADYVTVLAVTEHSTLTDSIKAARKNNKKIVADMINVHEIQKKVEELEELGIDMIAVHTGVDQQAIGRSPLNDLKEIMHCRKKAEIAVAGGISFDTLMEYMDQKPDVIIVGGGIFKANDPIQEARRFYEVIHG